MKITWLGQAGLLLEKGDFKIIGEIIVQILSLLHRQCKETGTTVVVITHNQALAAMADRIITMRSGRVVQIAVNDRPIPVEKLEW